MAEVRLASGAEADYTQALCWYAERSHRAAERFEAEFDQALLAIGTDPERFPRCDERHRYVLLRRFPYQVIYRGVGDRIVVVAVAHAKREPGYWHGR